MTFGDEFLLIGEGENQFTLENGKTLRNGKEIDLVKEARKKAFEKGETCPVCHNTEAFCSCEEDE